MSSFGQWVDVGGLPAFDYDVDPSEVEAARWDPIVAPPTNRHWLVIGNRRITACVDNLGTVGLFDESDGLRWITAPDPEGTGVTAVNGEEGRLRSRQFGPTWFGVELEIAGLEVRRTVLVPEGEHPWVLVRVDLSNPGTSSVAVDVAERWELRPRMLNLGVNAERARTTAETAIGFEVETGTRRVTARETPRAQASPGERFASVFGGPHVVVLEALGGGPVVPRSAGGPHPTLEIVTTVALEPQGTDRLWFRFGLDDGADVPDPEAWAEASGAALARRLPRASADLAPSAAREVPWHAALLSGGACVDGVLGGHTLNQASAYSYAVGFNGAARDPLQHALPLVYSEPDLALSVLRNTCAWASPDGDLPYALDGAKQPWTSAWQPSDQNLWAMWLAAEYAAATGDLDAFSTPVPFHPTYGAEPVPLAEHLRRQSRFFVEGVGLGEHGHVRMRNADWNDMAVTTSGVPHHEMTEKGESVLNSAMAAWVLPVFAGLCDRLGDAGTAGAARELGEQLRVAVAGEWNGRWFRRAYGPGRGAIGDDELWLEVQPWAILCGAATADQAADLLSTIDGGARSGSPLGARVRWPVSDDAALGGRGEGTNGGIWYSINMTLVWAAARVDAEMAWDEWRRMSLAAHADAYPDVWEGTLSGPDAYNSPESDRPGRTWAVPAAGFGMQAFPVSNLHSHCQPLLAYLRLLGIEPTPEGSLRAVGAVPEARASFESDVLTLRPDGSGCLAAQGPVRVETRGGSVSGGPGELRW